MVADGCRWAQMVVDGWERYGGGKLKSGPRTTNLASNKGGEGPSSVDSFKQTDLGKDSQNRVIYFNGKDWTDKNHRCHGDASEGNTIDFPLI